MDPIAADKTSHSAGWNQLFTAAHGESLAPGVDLFSGSWNSTIVRQPDGLVILEAPISQTYMAGIVGEAKKRYPGLAIKGVLSTSDSWPHTGGVRFAVSQGFPVYLLDLNRPLLDQLIRAPHTLDPDALQSARPKAPNWTIVAGKTVLGTGPNRLELYPLRGASTERQYLAYFPEHRLLYASDTLALNSDGTLYDPELMHEVAQAVEREGLSVDRVFAMHQGPMPWSQVMSLIAQSR